MSACYIAGPMRGYENYNFDAFDDAKLDVEELGYHAVSPADMDRLYEGWCTYPPKGWSPSDVDKQRMIDRDLAAIAGCDAIYLLRGWEHSSGAAVEKTYAEFLGKRVIFQAASDSRDFDPSKQYGDYLDIAEYTTKTARIAVAHLKSELATFIPEEHRHRISWEVAKESRREHNGVTYVTSTVFWRHLPKKANP